MVPTLRNGHLFDTVFSTPMSRFNRDINAVFDGLRTTEPSTSTLPVSLWEDEQNVHVEVEVPGLSQDQIDIQVHQGILAIRADRSRPADRKAIYDNRRYGQFERHFQLPESVQSDRIEAKLNLGVLTIRLPKVPEAQPHRVQIQAD